jgi:hypothetical protein
MSDRFYEILGLALVVMGMSFSAMVYYILYLHAMIWLHDFNFNYYGRITEWLSQLMNAL